MKQLVVDVLSRELGAQAGGGEIERLVEVPKDATHGDYAFPCFGLAKALKKNPKLIAEELAARCTGAPGIAGVAAAGGYCNFFVDKGMFTRSVFDRVKAGGFGRGREGGRVVVEFASPNTNKPLHLGHLRNMAIGESVARILAFAGNTVARTSINNDRGVHICKSMLAYRRLGAGKTPQTEGVKSDHFVGDYYVLFNKKASEDPSWNDEAQRMLQEWEAGDENVRSLWRTMNAWAFDGFRQTFRLFGIAFDKEYYESEIYTRGRQIVEEGLACGIFAKRGDGAVIVDLSAEGLGEKVLLRADGTTVYITQDLFLASLKHQDFAFDRSIYVVGNEQDHHFRMLAAILLRLGSVAAGAIRHLSYGMVELPEGKMKSREGTVVDADDLIAETRGLARAELAQRYTLSEAQLDERSLKIALAAIKYQLLMIDIAKTMVFDPKTAISFEGDTGPYLLYSYARASSILRRAAEEPAGAGAAGEPGPSEHALLKKIALFPETAKNAADKLMPSQVATYAFDLSQLFNEFYHQCPVLKSDSRAFRLELVAAFRTVLRECLHLLGIEEIEEM